MKNERKKKKGLDMQGLEAKELACQLRGVEGKPGVWGDTHAL